MKDYLFFIIVIAAVLAAIAVAIFTNFHLTDEKYERLKWLTIRWSYITTFLGLIVKTFDIPYGLETVTVVAGIGALMAGLLGVSIKNYDKTMKMYVEEPEGSYIDYDFSEEELAAIREANPIEDEEGGDENV